MEARELMVGSWVSFLEKGTDAFICGQVEAIDGEWCEVSCVAKDTLLRVTYKLKVERLKPIVLLHDLFVKNEFRRGCNYFVLADKKLADTESCGRLIWTNGHIETLVLNNKCGLIVGDCRFVHQLQRALKVFGVEKEIKL